MATASPARGRQETPSRENKERTAMGRLFFTKQEFCSTSLIQHVSCFYVWDSLNCTSTP